MPSTLFSIGSDFFLSEFQNFSTLRLECFQTIFLSIACSNLEILSIVFETEAKNYIAQEKFLNAVYFIYFYLTFH